MESVLAAESDVEYFAAITVGYLAAMFILASSSDVVYFHIFDPQKLFFKGCHSFYFWPSREMFENKPQGVSIEVIHVKISALCEEEVEWLILS